MALNTDIILSASSQLLKAATAAKLQPQEEDEVNGFANLVNTNRRLSNLNQQDARKEYLGLDENIQTVLKQWNPDAQYVKEPETGVFGTVKEKVLKPVLEKVVDYSELLNQPYRTLRVKQQRGLGWADSWRLAEGGNALFDLERESKVDAFYTPSVAKIAKQLSTGKTIGEIAATLQTPEDFAEFKAMLENSDPEKSKLFKEAIADYDTAKISLGRDIFVKPLSVDPGDFGANRKIFNRLSGAADLATQIFFDPLTYIPLAGQAYKASALSIVKIIEQDIKSGARLDSIAKAFDNPIYGGKVRRFFDTAGPQIKVYAEAADDATKAQVLGNVRRQFGENLSVETLEQFAKHQVFDAESAKSFLVQADEADLLLQGRQVKTVPTLPTYTVFQDIKFNLRNAVNSVTGVSKKTPLKTLDGEEITSGTQLLNKFIDAGLDSDKISAVENIVKQQYSKFDRFKRLFDIAPGRMNIKYEYLYDKTGKMVKDLGLQSASQIRALARTAGFDDAWSDDISLTWIKATPGERKKMYDGIVLSLANGMGLLSTPGGKDVFNRAYSALTKQRYSTNIPLTKELLDTLDPSMQKFLKDFAGATDEALAAGQRFDIDPSLMGGSNSKAVAEWQLSDGLRVPPIHEWQQYSLSNKNFLFRSMGEFFNGKIATGLVNGWTALTLLPRLGIRSILEESMVFGLTAPLKVIRDTMLYGYKATRQIRKYTGGDTKFYDVNGLGIPTRLIEKLTKSGLSPEDKIKLKTATKDEIADMIVKAQLQGRIVFKKGKAAKQFASDIDDFIKYGLGHKYWDDIRQRTSSAFGTDPIRTSGSNVPGAVAKAEGNTVSFNVNYEEATKGLIRGGQYVDVQYGTDQFYLNVLDLIIKTTEFSELGRLAIKNIEDSKLAIDNMVKYLDENPEIAMRFANAEGVQKIDNRVLAGRAYLNARIPFQTANGGLNMDLVSKIRKPSEKTKGVFDLVLEQNPNFNKRYFNKTKPNNIALVKTDFLDTVKEYDRTLPRYAQSGSQERIDKIAKDLEEGKGFTDPVFLEYTVDDAGNLRLLLGEGNHRLAAAKQAGVEYIPVQLVRIEDLERVKNLIGKSPIQRDKSGYLLGGVDPQDLLPENVVLKGQSDFNISSNDLTIEDLRSYRPEDMPTKILGQSYVNAPRNIGGVMENFVKYGYEWMDKQISTLVREPFFLANLSAYRGQLRGVQARKKNELLAKGLNENVAEATSRQYAEVLAEELAAKRTLQFVDNPEVRTNLAWSMRNFARFYRAQEDFYRRAYRTIFKNPQSIVRMRLATDALDHSGFVFQNDEPTLMGAGGGERYFVFPADQILSQAISPITKVLTGKDFAMPMPLEFTGKIKMLTPSLDPESSIPAFSGPLAGITFVALERMLPNFMGPIKDNLLQTTLGSYAKDVSWTDVALPSNVKRAIAAFDQDDQNSQFASAARKSLAYYAANGQGLKPDTLDANGELTIVSERQKYEFTRKVEATAMNVVVTRFFLGMISPVAPQVGFGGDIPRYLKETGNVNFKSEFNKLVNEIAATGTDDVYNKALQQWTKINPGLLAYTVGETSANKIATVKKTKDAAAWVKSNRDLVKQYPEGSAFFIPFSGEFGFDEYAFLKREGYIESLPIEDFIKRVSIAEDYAGYKELQTRYDEQIESAATPSMRAYYRGLWKQEKEEFLRNKPLLVEDLQSFEGDQKTRNALDDLRRMIDEGSAPKTALTGKYGKMIEVFDNAELSLSVLTGNTRFQRNQKERIRKAAMAQIEDIAAGDPQAESAVRVLFKRLIGV